MSENLCWTSINYTPENQYYAFIDSSYNEILSFSHCQNTSMGSKTEYNIYSLIS
jgi:hypothetical protein